LKNKIAVIGVGKHALRHLFRIDDHRLSAQAFSNALADCGRPRACS